jgi:addiction module HigA family antidote
MENWRMTLRFEGEDATLVGYRDYHCNTHCNTQKGELMRMHNPPHRGGILKDALVSIPMSVTQFAAPIGVARVALSRVICERAGFTPEMSIRISQALGQPTEDIWFKMQNEYDFWQASQKKRKKVRALHWKSEAETAAKAA